MSIAHHPVLIIGGSGIVGSKTARTLRELYPDLPIVIGGRNLARAEAVASEIVGATAASVDLTRRDLGLSDTKFSGIAIFVKDDTVNALRYAQDHRIPHVSVSSGTYEIGPEVAAFVHQPLAAPIYMGSQWLVGAAVMPTLEAARDFDSLDEIHIGVLLDEEDMGGPAAYADFERLTAAVPAALTLKDGQFVWIVGEQAAGRITSVDGRELAAQAYAPLDIISLASATDARSIRFDFVLGESASRRRGEPFSTEIVIDMRGTRAGASHSARLEIMHPLGQAPLTALGVSLALERLIGLDGRPPAAPGLYLPEVLIDPSYFVERMKAFGAHVVRR